MESNINIYLTDGRIINGYQVMSAGEYLLVQTKECKNDMWVVTQTPIHLGTVKNIVSTYPVEKRELPPEEPVCCPAPSITESEG